VICRKQSTAWDRRGRDGWRKREEREERPPDRTNDDAKEKEPEE